MFRRQRAVAACVLLAFLGLAFLFLHARSITPRALALSEIGADDVGAPVRVRGHVHRTTTTEEGNAAITLVDYEDFASIRVIARPRAVSQPTLVAPGATVEVVGSVFSAGGTIQVFAEEAGAVTVLAPPGSNLLPLEFVARNAPRLAGHRVVIRAELADLWTVLDPRYARLRSNGSELWAFSPDGWREGRLDVTGRLVISSRGRCEMSAGVEPNPIDATLPALATCPEVLLGQAVRVRSVLVEPGEARGTGMVLRDLGDGAEFRLAAFVPGWDWRDDGREWRLGGLLTLEGTVDYQPTEARWRIVADEPPRP